MIRFRQIEAFHSVMKTGSSMGAARELQVTQPAISRLIADLEAEVSLALFDRAGGRLRPTATAQRLFEVVQECYASLERIRRAADVLRSGTREEFTVACVSTFGSTVLPAILRAFKARRSNVQVSIDFRNTTDIVSDLRNHKVHAALCLAVPTCAGIASESLFSARLMCALPVSHRLAPRSRIAPEQLAGESIIGPLPDSLTAGLDGNGLSSRMGALRPGIAIHEAYTRYAMVASGLGVAVVDSSEAKLWRSHDVVVRPFDEPVDCAYVVAYPSDSVRSPLLADFLQATRSAIQEAAPVLQEALLLAA